MKKYKIWGQVGTHSFEYEIEADNFIYTHAGVYVFVNSVTNKKWCFPITRTVVETIDDK